MNPESKLKDKVLLGILGGALGCSLMYFSIRITSTVILDLRNLAEVAVAAFGGPISVIISGIIIMIFRAVYFGINTNTIIILAAVAIICIVCAFISTINAGFKKKYFMMLTSSIILRSIIYCILIKDLSLLIKVLLVFCIGSILVGVLVYYLIEYLVTSYMLLQQLKESSTTDFLTGLNNTRSFDEFFNYSVKNAKEKDEQLSLLMVDIDFFKKVNDTYGHPIGDIVLKDLGKVLSSACRGYDFVSRIGGEEFSVILPDTPIAKSIEVGERIRKAVKKHEFKLPDDKIIHVTVSVGVATYPDTVDDIENILEKADEGLYKAKRTGRNKVEVG
ncbi:MAG: GGDEF domain-containing protein [Clostridiaceae bacterium]